MMYSLNLTRNLLPSENCRGKALDVVTAFRASKSVNYEYKNLY